MQRIINGFIRVFNSIEHINGVNIGIDELGTKIYFVNDRYHREDGPAIETICGHKVWCINGIKHRLDGPAVITSNGLSKQWFVNGLLHRLDGPAVEYSNNYKEWRINGILHRLDGPAIEWGDGAITYYVGGQEVNPVPKTKKVN